MKLRKYTIALRVMLLCLVTALLCACGSDAVEAIGEEIGKEIDGFTNAGEDQSPPPLDESYTREPPPIDEYLAKMGDNQTTSEMAGRWAMLDLTNTAKGYVGAQATGSSHGMFIVTNNTTGASSKYIMNSEGQDQFFPLSMGDGSYVFNVYVHDGSEDPNSYLPILEGYAEVALENEFAPFLVNNAIVNYNAESECVKLSYELAQHAETKLQVASTIYQWIQQNITYDTALAESVAGGANYVPNPDSTIQSGTGICYDYASLAAAMMRANGIPCKLIKGDADTGEGNMIYHAWNRIWFEETGWIDVKVGVTGEEWNLIDLTFASSLGSGIAEFIGDGNTDTYVPMSEH